MSDAAAATASVAPPASEAAGSSQQEQPLQQQELCVKWSGQEFTLHLSPNDTVGCLKRELEAVTQVSVKRQKLLGLTTKDKKPAKDEALIGDLAIKANAKVFRDVDVLDCVLLLAAGGGAA